MIVVVKTVSGKEGVVAERIESVAKRINAKIYAIIAPANIKGYVFVECENEGEVLKVIYGMKDAKGIAKGKIKIDEIRNLLQPVEKEVKIEVGQKVIITGGPFKGEKAKVVSVNYEKKKVTIELINFPVSTPITTKLEYVKPLKGDEE